MPSCTGVLVSITTADALYPQAIHYINKNQDTRPQEQQVIGTRTKHALPDCTTKQRLYVAGMAHSHGACEHQRRKKQRTAS